jgi:long-chain acyl-CoA synthetase
MDAGLETGPPLPYEGVAAGARTLGEVFRRRAEKSPSQPACYQKVNGVWRKTTWRELYDLARQAAGRMVEAGFGVGDRIAIVGPTHLDWAVYDLAGHLAGLCTIGIYPKQTPEQVRYLLEHSEAKAIFVADDEEMKTAVAAAEGLATLEAIVAWTPELYDRFQGQDPRLESPALFRRQPLAEEQVAARQEAIDPGTPAIIVYTSGTTGPPKGAMISHRNILHLLGMLREVVDFKQDDLLLSFLPMAHVTERVLGFYTRLEAGLAAAYASSVGSVLAELPEVRPTIFGSVPRIFEKLYSGIHSKVAQAPKIRQAIFHWADRVARERIRLILAGKEVPGMLALQYRLADKLVFAKIRALLGGKVRFCLTGAAPISYDILEFLWAIGLPILEAYGMTEATVVTHINRLDEPKLGTVGKTLPSLECLIADDGEILTRGPLVFLGYFKQPEATAETLAGGWLHTGDIGSLDEQGFLRITDRKKHLIITAGGKNVAPANIERAVKMQSPLISQVHAHGDRRAFISALIAPSPLETLAWGVEHGLLDKAEADARTAELLASPTERKPALNVAMAKVVADRRFQELFKEAVRKGNKNLARVERVRRYFVLDRDFSAETGEMTPTMKMKRKEIERMYADRFDRVYTDDSFAIEAESAADAG